MDKKILARLKTISIFGEIENTRLRQLAGHMKTRRIRAREKIVAEGDVGEEMYILLEGEVKITKRTLDREEYTVVLLRDEDTPFFGELALLDNDKRSATITAVSACTLLTLTRKGFEQFGNEEPAAAMAIMRPLAQLLTRRLRDTSAEVILLFETLVKEVRAREMG